MKLYVIGPTGSGKSTLAKSLSKKHNIPSYELDLLVYDDENGHVKRPDKVREEMFNKILRKKNWIIEDVGRERFKKGREYADVIYYIKLPKTKAYYRVIKRWIKQKLGIEKYNHPPTFKQLLYFISIVKSYYKNEKSKLKDLEEFKEKLVFVNKRKIKDILKESKQ